MLGGRYLSVPGLRGFRTEDSLGTSPSSSPPPSPSSSPSSPPSSPLSVLPSEEVGLVLAPLGLEPRMPPPTALKVPPWSAEPPFMACGGTTAGRSCRLNLKKMSVATVLPCSLSWPLEPLQTLCRPQRKPQAALSESAPWPIPPLLGIDAKARSRDTDAIPIAIPFPLPVLVEGVRSEGTRITESRNGELHSAAPLGP